MAVLLCWHRVDILEVRRKGKRLNLVKDVMMKLMMYSCFTLEQLVKEMKLLQQVAEC